MIEIPKLTIDIAVVTGIIALIGLLGRLVYRISRYLDHMSCMLDEASQEAYEGDNAGDYRNVDCEFRDFYHLTNISETCF